MVKLNNKICSKCNLKLPLSSYQIRTDNKSRTLRNICKKCQHKRRKELRSYETWYNSDKGKKWKKKYEYEYRLLKQFGINIEQFNYLKKSQNGKCKICGSLKSKGWSKKLNVDHCHKSNKIRGLLCNLCNVGLGAFHDDISKLKGAISYLINFNTHGSPNLPKPTKQGIVKSKNVYIKHGEIK